MKILKRLEEESVFYLDISTNKFSCTITEACDNFFKEVLTKKELIKLIAELQDLANQMKEIK